MRYILLPLLALLVACDNDSNFSGTKTPPNQDASGIWNGTITDLDTGTVNPIDCLIASTGEVACLIEDETSPLIAAGLEGSVTVSNGDEVSGSGDMYAAGGFILADGSELAAVSVDAALVAERDWLEAFVTGPGSFEVSLTYDPIYERGSSLEAVAGVYDGFEVNGDPASLAINEDGEMFGQSVAGCVGNGQVSLIDAAFNEYRAELTVSECGEIDGTYTGLLRTGDASGTDDVLFAALFSGTNALMAYIFK